MNNCQSFARPKYIPEKSDLQFCRISQCLFAVLCQIVCLNLVYFTFLVLDVLSAEIFISLPLRSCAFSLVLWKNVLTCSMCIWVIVFILITWVPVEGAWVVWPVLSLTISCLAFIHSLWWRKFLLSSRTMSLETMWSWNLHAQSSLLKGDVGIIKINVPYHTMQKSPSPSQAPGCWKKKKKTIQAHPCCCSGLSFENKLPAQTYTHIPYYI